MGMNKYNKNTSIRLDEEVKPWVYRKAHLENRSLGNLINTILKKEKEREKIGKEADENFKAMEAYLDALNDTK